MSQSRSACFQEKRRTAGERPTVQKAQSFFLFRIFFLSVMHMIVASVRCVDVKHISAPKKGAMVLAFCLSHSHFLSLSLSLSLSQSRSACLLEKDIEREGRSRKTQNHSSFFRFFFSTKFSGHHDCANVSSTCISLKSFRVAEQPRKLSNDLFAIATSEFMSFRWKVFSNTRCAGSFLARLVELFQIAAQAKTTRSIPEPFQNINCRIDGQEQQSADLCLGALESFNAGGIFQNHSSWTVRSIDKKNSRQNLALVHLKVLTQAVFQNHSRYS